MINKFLSGKAVIYFTVAGILVLMLLQKYWDHKNAISNRKDCYTELKKEINGVVEKAFSDENPNHKGFVIEFTNGNTYRPNFLSKWRDINLNKGDSIYKKSGTFKVEIFRKEYEQALIVEDSINCDELE